MTSVTSSSNVRTGKFTTKLFRLLSEAEKKGHDDIVSWSPDGTSFRVHNKDRFEREIMPVYFGTAKFRTFQKNLNLWGFTAVRRGSLRGTCSHPFFRRQQPHMCCYIIRRQFSRNGRPVTSADDASESRKIESHREEALSSTASRPPAKAVSLRDASPSGCASSDSLVKTLNPKQASHSPEAAREFNDEGMFPTRQSGNPDYCRGLDAAFALGQKPGDTPTLARKRDSTYSNVLLSSLGLLACDSSSIADQMSASSLAGDLRSSVLAYPALLDKLALRSCYNYSAGPAASRWVLKNDSTSTLLGRVTAGNTRFIHAGDHGVDRTLLLRYQLMMLEEEKERLRLSRERNFDRALLRDVISSRLPSEDMAGQVSRESFMKMVKFGK